MDGSHVVVSFSFFCAFNSALSKTRTMYVLLGISPLIWSKVFRVVSGIDKPVVLYFIFIVSAVSVVSTYINTLLF